MTTDDISALRDQRDAENAELRRLLPKALLDQERRASRSCWHAYSFMGAMQRTRQFAADYEAAFQSTFGMRCELRPQPGTKEYETLWKMRQAADDELMSYPLYLEVSFHQVRRKDPAKFSVPHVIFIRRQQRPLWRRLFKKVLAERYWSDFNRLACMPEYHRSNYAGLAAQDHLRARLSRDTSVHSAVRNARAFAIEHKIVPLKQVLSKLSEDDRREAVRRLKEEVQLGQIIPEAVPPARCDELVESSYGWVQDRPNSTGAPATTA